MKVRQNIQKYTPCNHLKLETALENNLKLCRKYTACSTSRYLPTVDCWFSRKYNIYIFGHKEKLLNSPLLDTLVHCKKRTIITQQTIGNQTKSGKSDYWKIDTKKKSNISFLSLLENWYFLDFLNRPHIIWYLNDLQVPACQFRFLENADTTYHKLTITGWSEANITISNWRNS